MRSLKSHMIAAGILCLMMLISFSIVPDSHGASIQKEIYQRLDNIRETKKRQLFEYLVEIKENANTIKTDKAMLAFFQIKNQYYQLKKTMPPPDTFIRELDKLKNNIRDHYIRHYRLFYDILFVNKAGDIFYTIRQQADYHKNIFQGELGKTTLARQLKNNSQQMFVDYQYYTISCEPSAFFVVPVLKAGAIEGWFILQCAINKINNMFLQGKELGSTGEIFLVNKQQYMLTDSRFYRDSSILKKHLSHENIISKFREKTGHKIVTDYRGYRVFSSFDVCKIDNSEWLLIAKIDEDELITEQYIKKKQEIKTGIIQKFNREGHHPCIPLTIDEKPVEVDMDEFRQVNKKEMISTKGVATCTAVIVTFPGKFSYMAHISNFDRIYNGRITDLMEQIFKRINTFDIYPYEKRNLQITIIANHLKTIINTVNILIDKGIFLSQIKFMHNSKAIYGNVLHDYVKNQTQVDWLIDRESGVNIRQCASNVQSVGDLIKPLLQYKCGVSKN